MHQQTPPKRELLAHTLRQNLRGVLSIVFGVFLISVALGTAITTFRPLTIWAAVNNTVNFQARLQSANGAIAPDGTYNVEFKLYDALTGGTNLWTETRVGVDKVRVANGYLTVDLGSVTAFPGSINWDQQLYLTMNIGGTGAPSWDGEMNPRLKLTAVPYAFRAKSATQLQTIQGAYTGTLSFAALTNNRTITAPDESGTICLQNSSSCGFLTGATADGSYIQNTTTQQVGANFNIDGTGVAATFSATTALQAPTLDTATATALNIGTTNATALNIFTGTKTGAINLGNNSGGDITIRSGGTIYGIGDTVFKPQSDSAAAFRVQNAGGGTIFDVDSSSGYVGIGTMTPGAQLHVKATTEAAYVFIEGISDGDNYSTLELRNTTGTSKWQFSNKSLTGHDKNFEFNHYNGTSWSTPFTITDAGRIGINTTAPGYVLDTNGDINTSTIYRAGGTAGVTTTCSGGQFLQNQVVQGGIVTGGSCAAGGAGPAPVTLQATTTGTADTGNFKISGTGIASALWTSSLDVASAGTLTIGGGTATTVNIATNAIAHTVAIANGAAAQAVTIGSTNGASALTLQAGTGNFLMSGAVTSTFTFGSTTQTGAITLGRSTASNTINIGTGTTAAAATQTINIGTSATSTGKAAIIIGNTNGASAVTLQAGTGNINLSGATVISGTTTLSKTGANALAVSGAPINTATSSLVQLGAPIALGNTAVNGGTYLGLNAPSAGAGSAADFLNFQKNGVSMLQVTNTGDITATGDLDVAGTTTLQGNVTLAGCATFTQMKLDLGGCGGGGYDISSASQPLWINTTMFGLDSSDSTFAFQVQNAGANPVFNVDTTTTTGNHVTIRSYSNSTTAFQVQNAAGTSMLTVDTTGTGLVTAPLINSVGGYKFNGTAGATTSCTGGQFLQNATIQGGIVTSGSCATAAAASGVTTIGAIDGGTYSANGASISGSTLYLQAASDIHVGLVTTSDQTFKGIKTFTSGAVINNTANTSAIPLTIQTAVDSRPLSAELMTASYSLTAASGWTAISGTGQSATATHTTGNTTPLTINPAMSLTADESYKLSFTITGRTTGYVMVYIGGAPLNSSLYSTGSTINFTALASGDLSFVPYDTTFDGTITGVSLKQYTGIIPASLSVEDSSGTAAFELRVDDSNNTFLGLNSGQTNVTGNYNTASGAWALENNTTGSQNTASGTFALQYNTTGSSNTASSAWALRNNTTGVYNTASGVSALQYNTTGGYNTASGAWALQNNTTGAYNTASGMSAGNGNNCTSGAGCGANGNALFGYRAGYNVQTGADYNLMQGYNAGYSVTTGAQNILLGYNAGQNITTGSSNIIIGAGIDAASATGSNQLNIGNIIQGNMTSGSQSLNLTGSVTVSASVNAVNGYKFNGTAGATTSCTGGQFLQDATIQGGIVTSGSCATATNGVTTIGLIDGGTYSANGASISGTTLYLQAATATHVGLVTTGAQTFGGNKTFNGALIVKAASETSAAFILQSTDGSAAIEMRSGGAGRFNTFIGLNSGMANTSGIYNTASGSYALTSNTTGNNNTASGAYALQTNTTGRYNTASGTYALQLNTGGTQNTASGYYALQSNTIGDQNTASGAYALWSNTTGFNNAASGAYALQANTSGIYNTASGSYALTSNTTGNNNTAVGYTAGYGNNCASGAGCAATGNALFGYQAGYSIQTGANYNLMQGYNAGYAVTTGAQNVLLGYNAGQNLTTGGNNIIIGAGLNAASATGNYQLNIGNLIQGNMTSGSKSLSLNGSTTIQATTDSRPMSAELMTTSYGFSAASGWTAISGTGQSATATHTAGNTTPLTINPALNLIAGNEYQLSFTISGQTTGWINLVVGGTTVNIYVSSATEQFKAPASGNLSFVPTTDFDGTITGVSLKQYTGTLAPALSVKNASGSTAFELRVTSSTNNTFLGLNSGQSNTTGYSNTASGSYALQSNTTGYENTATGTSALQSNTTGVFNTASGAYALTSNTTGQQNTANGIWALRLNTTGDENTASGAYALTSNTTGYDNTASGAYALTSNTTGNNNTASGAYALESNTTGTGNTASGTFVLSSNTTGINNTASGYGAGASYDCATGAGCGGSGNALFGYQAGYNVQTGADYNLMQGYNAGYGVTTGAQNILLGYSAGQNLTTGSNNIIIGAGVDVASATGSYQLNIGNLLTGDLSVGTAQFKGQLTVGTASVSNGSLVVANSSNANTVTIKTGVTTASYSLVLPTAAGAGGQCLAATSVSGTDVTLGWGACSGGGGGGSHTIKIAPEFPNTVFTTGGQTNTIGFMQTDLDTGLSALQGYKHTYYSWTTDQATPQTYDITMLYQVPSDFTSFTSGSFKLWAYGTDNTKNGATVIVKDVDGTQCMSYAVSLTNLTWTQTTLPDLTSGGCSFGADDLITITFRVSSASATTNETRIGEVQFTYN